ncbi:MAG: exodeoxyribonuclease VII large subunit [Victivallaceae bacterium]|nr:exodeoxyribonuclease VII large subunit [Victivallaceae bacterium]
MDDCQVVWSVSDVNRAMREIVEGSLLPFWLRGEVGSLTLHRSGHAYFSLKDAHSQIRIVYFNGAAAMARLGIANGSLIEAFGNLTVYEARGEYQFGVKELRPAGQGELQRRFEELKNKLAAEGLFEPSRKKPIPMLPAHIGVVTSPTGAAICDFLNIIDRRFPNVNVRIYPCQVQGSAAAAQVAAGVDFFNRAGGVDVIVVTRGGGSMEDLWCFNEEIIARSIAASHIPVISAVGHEIDFTICDFAADLRVPTPSAAAELVIGKREELAEKLARLSKDLDNSLMLLLTRCRARFDRAAGSFVFREPRHLVEMRRQQLDELENRIGTSARRGADAGLAKLDKLAATLETLNPARQLERGYAILFDPAENKPVTSCRQPKGKRLSARLADGSVDVEVI